MFDELKGPAPGEEQVEVAATRYLQFQNTKKTPTASGGVKDEVADMAQEYKTFKTQVLELREHVPDTLELKEKFAVYYYTKRSDINKFVTGIYHPKQKNVIGISVQTKPNKELKGATKELLQEHEAQAVLLQSYLKKNSITEPITVYRWEPDSFVDRFKKGETYVENSFMSTSKSNNRHVALGAEGTVEKRPTVIEIRLKKSGSDISRVNRSYENQQEVLIPFGTQFHVISKEKAKEDGKNTVKIVMEEVV